MHKIFNVDEIQFLSFYLFLLLLLFVLLVSKLRNHCLVHGGENLPHVLS